MGTDLKSVPIIPTTKKGGFIMEGKEKAKGGDELIVEACKAYGIDPKYIFASRIDKVTGEAVVVTNGGKKVRYKTGDKVAPLDPIAVTGINPKPKRKPIAGAAKE
jgi:hypothetical protein